MSNREYSTTDAAHGLNGFSSNSGALGNPDGLWSHQPVHEGPKDGFHDPIEAAPTRAQLWTDQNQPDAPDDAAGFNAVDTTTPGTLGRKVLNQGSSSPGKGFSGAGRTGSGSGTERGNSPWFRGGPH